MQAMDKKFNLSGFEEVDLSKEFNKALKDPIFKMLVEKSKLKEENLKNYTSILEECASEYTNCTKCSSLLDCQNKIPGHVYLPIVKQKQLYFEYKRCKHYEKSVRETKHLENVKYFNTPSMLRDATISKIHKNDKNRFEAIKWIGEFYKNYNPDNKMKGIYFHGNFGCGKTYLIAALLNDLAKQGHRSGIVFWPDFLRSAFDNDFREKYEYVRSVPLLLIDDIGAENLTAWNRDEILCPLLQYRMEEGLTTFFTSNLNLKELEEHLSNSKAGVETVKAGRIISRIKQLAKEAEMISKNLRN